MNNINICLVKSLLESQVVLIKVLGIRPCDVA